MLTWWICWRFELVSWSKYKFDSCIFNGWKLGYSSSLVPGSALNKLLVSNYETACKYTGNGVCMVRHGRALAGFYPSRKVALVGASSAASWCCCSNFVEMTLRSSLRWARCWGLGSAASHSGSCEWSGAGRLNRSSGSGLRMLTFGCWGPLAEGVGLDQWRPCVCTVRLPVRPDVLVCFLLGNEIPPLHLLCQLPAIPGAAGSLDILSF